MSLCELLPGVLEEPLFLRRFSLVLLVSAVALCASFRSFAQEQPSTRPDEPKAGVFGGYSDYRSGGKFNGVTVPEFTKGWAGEFIFNMTPRIGAVVQLSGHSNDFASAHDFAAGLHFQRPVWHVLPFGEALVGFQHFSPKALSSQNTPTYIASVGLDVKINSRFSIRPIQFSSVNTYFSANSTSSAGAKAYLNVNGYRMQSGLVYKLGLSAPEGNVELLCNAAPSTVYPGDTVKVAVTAKGFLPKRVLTYTYESTGGNIIGNQGSAAIDTTGVQPGAYTVNAKVMDNGKGKHQQTASCQAALNVKATLPPTLSVTASPDSLNSGDTSTITANGSSPDQRTLSYACTVDRGHISGAGATYTLDTAGIASGTITVSCTVNDDRKLSASASSSVEIKAHELPQPSKFGNIEFKHDLKRPARVDNEAKGELDRYADALAATTDAKGVVVGYASVAEDKDNTKPLNMAAQRAVNTKDYLKKDKGVDASRIEPRTATGGDQKVELWIVPAAANFTAEGTAIVDESKVKAVPRVPLKPRTHKKWRTQPHKRHSSPSSKPHHAKV